MWSLFRRTKRVGYAEAELLSVYRDYGVVPKSSRADNFNNPSEDLSLYQLVECGDLAINKMKAWQGSVAISEYTGIVSPAYFVFTPTHKECSRYLHYLMRSVEYTFAYQALSKGIRPNQWDLEPQEHSRMDVLIPPLPEQQAIAAFLDRETAKIDGLIEEQRRLIALLAEKRQATISHAVTRGLNPSARLKPSGVDWLGDVPEGWEVRKLRHSAKLQGGYAFSSELFGSDGVAVVRMTNLNRGRLELANAMHIPDQFINERVALNEGDLLWGMSGSVGDTGSLGNYARVVEGDLPCQLNQRVGRFLVEKSKVNIDFLEIIIQARYFYEQILLWVTGTAQFNISSEQVEACFVAIPPLHEQAAIVDYVHAELAAYASLTEAASSAISLMHERRAALISAAVTGKIDVRDEQASPVQIRKSLPVSVLLGGVIIAALGRHPSMGRMLVQKHLFMAEAHAGVSELQGNYDRKAAGPFDSDLQRRVEADLVAAGLLRVAQDGGPGSRVDYEFLGDAAALRADLAVALGDRMARFDDAFRQLADLSKPGIEAVATLYAAWNDFLMDGKKNSRDDIIGEVLENWHPEKAEKFTRADLVHWLDWMDRHQMVPTGTGPKTQTGRLFP